MRAFKAIVAVLALSLLAAGSASAQGWGGHGRGGGRSGPPGGGRGGYAAPAGPQRMARPGLPPAGYVRGGGYPPNGPPGGAYAPRGYARPEMGGYPAYAPPPADYAPRGGWRRGQFFPGGPAGGQALDPRRYHLRSPPPGYIWYGVGRDAYLVQRSTGLILDTAPGAW